MICAGFAVSCCHTDMSDVLVAWHGLASNPVSRNRQTSTDFAQVRSLKDCLVSRPCSHTLTVPSSHVVCITAVLTCRMTTFCLANRNPRKQGMKTPQQIKVAQPILSTHGSSSHRSCGKSGRKANSFNGVPETLQQAEMHQKWSEVDPMMSDESPEMLAHLNLKIN